MDVLTIELTKCRVIGMIQLILHVLMIILSTWLGLCIGQR